MSIKRFVIVASAKGGVGKSTASRAFLDLARKAGRIVSAFDLDGGTGSLALLYKDRDPEVGVGSENVRSPKAPGKWIEALHSSADDVLLDCPGGAMKDLVSVFDDGVTALIDEAKLAGREIVVVSVLGNFVDSVFAPMDHIKLFGTNAHHIALLNGYFGDQEDFVIYNGFDDENGVKQFGKVSAAVREACGETLYFPKLGPITSALLDVKQYTFAKGAEDIKGMGRRHSSNCRTWLNAVHRNLAGSWLDTSGEVPTATTHSSNVVTETASTNGVTPSGVTQNGKAVRAARTESVSA
jgi:hypothetical protein